MRSSLHPRILSERSCVRGHWEVTCVVISIGFNDVLQEVTHCLWSEFEEYEAAESLR